jgi:hypothetical protein
MKTGELCVMCNRIGEDGGHLFFFKCKHVKELWRCACLENWREKLSACQTAMEVVKMILSIRGDIQLKVMFPLCNWWHERNAVREGEQKRLPNSIASLCWKQTLEVTTLNKAMQQNGYRSEQGDKMATTSTGAPENQC